MTPDWLVLGSAFLSALLGGAHCAAMCGGIATAFPAKGGGSSLRAAVEANLGRVGGYMLAGSIAGGLGHGIVDLSRSAALKAGLRAAVGLILILAALRLLDTRGRLASLGTPGRAVWEALRPLHRHLLPAHDTPRRLIAGALWGWLPCGLSSTLLAAAWLQAQALGGALTMAAFGLGTLPLMIPLTWSGSRVRSLLHQRASRIVAALLILVAGIATAAAPWLMEVPAAHRVLAALGCGSLTP